MKTKKLLSLTLLGLLCSVGNVWGAESATNNPATVSYGTGAASKTFLDVANTVSNATISSGSIACVTYGLYEMDKNWKPAFYSGPANGSSSSYNYTNASNYGFMAGSSAGTGTAANKSATSGYGAAKYTSEASAIVYVTGITGVAVMGKDNNTKSEKRLYIKVEEYAADGTCTAVGTGDGITKSSYNTSLHYTEFDAGTLTGQKYYKITLTSGADSNCETSQIRFTKYIAPSGPTITAQTIADANYVQGTGAASVTALSVIATASAGDLSYQWYKNTANSTTTPAPTAIDGATSNSYKPTTSESGTLYYFCKVTDSNGSVYSEIAKIVVSAATAPTINVSGAGNVVRDGEITLTAEFTGVPDPSIAWYACSSVGVISGEPLDGDASFSPSTSIVGTYYFRAVVNNGVGGDASNNVYSEIQIISINPKTPSITAGGYFSADSKSVTIAKADGEDGSAVIKYSTNNGTTWSDYNAALNVTETTTVQAKVVQSGLESEVVSATFTKFVKSTLESISSATTWNWESWTETLELGASSDPIGTEEYTYSDIATIKSLTLPSGFNGATIAYKGVSGTNNYPVRNKKAQAIGLHINITEPGTLTIKFSDTGSSGDSHNRYLNINGTNTEYYTCRHDSKNDTKTVTITGVPTGDVWIKAVKDDGSTETMVVFYTVTFTPVTSVSGTISSIGWNSFASAYPLDLSTISGGTGFYASAVEDNIVTLTSTTGKVPAGTGLLIRGTAGDEFTISTTSEATTPLSNILVGTTAVTNVDASSVYVLAGAEKGKPYFQLYSGTSIVANKAYIASGSVSSPDRIRFVIEGEQNATGMEDVKAGVEVIKFIENSQLLIKKNGIVYDVTGRIVK